MIQSAKRLETVQEYYFSKKLREVNGLIAEGKPIINMGIGSPDMAPAKEVLEALTTSLTDPKAHQYQSYVGLPELRKAIADFYKRHFKVDVEYNTEILPLLGSKEGIMHISMAFLNEGDEVLIPNPGYPTYTSVTKLVGGVPNYYDLREENDWLPDIEALEAQDLSKVKLMWLNYPHMPTGAKGNLEMFKELVAFAKRNDILLVNDNPYSFVLNTDQISILNIEGAKEVALELNSLSKTFNMAGWRIGFVLGSQEHIQAVIKVKSNMDSGMFYSLQKGAVKALELSNGWYDRINEQYQKRRELIYELADRLDCEYDRNAVGMFVWAKVPDHVESVEAFIDEVLYNQSIFITPGSIFGSNGDRFIRFSLCVPEDKIKEAINRF
ncbi:pyridoxal phosphate-dependent aminotransferase [Zhouia amylolytica]|uniref:pyridoxal phosphate-dependent aminotransferase n=1 Tax=Zhouia amylolytica TaxID=376730 RepID=UPI0020CFC536|nr:aminotransferase class I/II-fold pyridoxal phosphate-dependent enzyme [Zhouia amylolytica]MCQ0110607.1 aminotransferase class I/II-fold pyridoxal phosphate-dependent enzyme [Zhouia amylolytica]